jgi:hypothetical protein
MSNREESLAKHRPISDNAILPPTGEIVIGYSLGEYPRESSKV